MSVSMVLSQRNRKRQSRLRGVEKISSSAVWCLLSMVSTDEAYYGILVSSRSRPSAYLYRGINMQQSTEIWFCTRHEYEAAYALHFLSVGQVLLFMTSSRPLEVIQSSFVCSCVE
jgi:hypothetical protein